MKKKIIICLIILISLCGIFVGTKILKIDTTETLSKYGSNSNEVKQIQEKLKRWGYYKGNVDGIYGSKTVSAVKSFQKKNGLTVDGIAGDKTLSAMGIQSSGSQNNSSNSNNTNDVKLLSRVIYGEARGEPYVGQVAVGAVILNRVNNSSFPNTLSGFFAKHDQQSASTISLSFNLNRFNI